jgi:hypothetical protein
MDSYRFLETASRCILPALPLFAFAGLIALCLRRREHEQGNRDWREAFLYAVVVWATLTFTFTELLSLFSALNALFLALFWGCADLALLLLWLRFGQGRILNLPASIGAMAKGLSRGQKALLLWIAVSLQITGLIAAFAPPSTGIRSSPNGGQEKPINVAFGSAPIR